MHQTACSTSYNIPQVFYYIIIMLLFKPAINYFKFEDIAKAFADCLGGLLSTVAQKIQVEIEVIINDIILKIKNEFD